MTDFAQTPPVSVPRTSNARSNPSVFLFTVIKPCVDPHEPWTWKGACASAGRNDPPANATRRGPNPVGCGTAAWPARTRYRRFFPPRCIFRRAK
ncbi:hypothetical protein SBA5_230006 [Candidatus Sulfotelmatomonas gaucii]|uniref:Uncharacterized protein n=1 Tax=Candidatus Sulfuritelmatomonas gaucii TaxID=2043161 RepID=A0A2N9L7Z2_9BACT|nr:hypothetical protein SBA5_230006 [Candidatus Sulfotelmatomonas gaucii]